MKQRVEVMTKINELVEQRIRERDAAKEAANARELEIQRAAAEKTRLDAERLMKDAMTADSELKKYTLMPLEDLMDIWNNRDATLPEEQWLSLRAAIRLVKGIAPVHHNASLCPGCLGCSSRGKCLHCGGTGVVGADQ